MKLPVFPVSGGCACGAVRYLLTAAPPFVYTCHCTDCQTLTTSAFTLSASVPRETVEIRGELMSWIRTTTESGNHVPQHVCKKCGVRIYSEPSAGAERITLRLGTLDDTRWLNPKAAIWMKSAQPWFKPPEDWLVYDKGFDDPRAVARVWQAQWVS